MPTNGRSAGSKTFDKGLSLLEQVCGRPDGSTLTELASELHLHPTVIHRLLTTLENHRLIMRDENKRIFPGRRLVALSASVDASLQTAAQPVLRELADACEATSYLMVAISVEEAMAEVVVQPKVSHGHVAFSPGQIHPIGRGSGGVAILSGRTASPADDEAVQRAREEGYAVSVGEIVPHVIGVAAPVRTRGTMPEASIGVSLFRPEALDDVAPRVIAAAQQLSERL
jgi:DNA-binding IclR family transcriptional regulator